MSHSLPHTKVTRDGWIEAALRALDDVPIDRLRILPLAEALSVSRSSFYWYFDHIGELQDELIRIWDRNTRSIVDRAHRPADSAVAACLGVFECWADRRLFDAPLDGAVRDWGRRDTVVGERVDTADTVRLDALSEMFSRFGFDSSDSVVRARLLYHSQVGYYALGTEEPLGTRLAYLPYYLEAMAGAPASDKELANFEAFLTTVAAE